MEPILSICIPTYNRARLLELFLLILEAEVKPFGHRVEVVVSDNCSPDDTEEVVKSIQHRYPISYRRLPTNMGGLFNIVTIVTEVARGKYCWVLGDDDLLRPGSVAKMMDIIEDNPEIPYIFVNHSYEQHSERENYRGMAAVPSAFDPGRLLCKDTSEKKVAHWEDIVLLCEVPALFTSLVCHVFLKEIWVRQAPGLGRLEPEISPVLTLNYGTVFPHVSMLASELVGKPAYYVGFPYVMFFVGSQEWLGIWQKYLFTFVLQIADQMEKAGASATAVNQYRSLVFQKEGAAFRNLMFHTKRARSQGGEWTKWKFRKDDDFSFFRLLGRHWKNLHFRRMVAESFRQEISDRLRSLRGRLGNRLRKTFASQPHQ